MAVWSNLPNAAHIDSIIESVKLHPGVWAAVGTIAGLEVWSAAWNSARVAACDAARGDIRQAALVAVALSAVRSAVRNTAFSAVAALITYDESAKYLGMTGDKLKVWAFLSEDPAAVLLVPAVIAYERIMELETA